MFVGVVGRRAQQRWPRSRASAGATARPGCRASARPARRPAPAPTAGAAAAAGGRSPIAARHWHRPGPPARPATTRRCRPARSATCGRRWRAVASMACELSVPTMRAEESARPAVRWNCPARSPGRPRAAARRAARAPAVRPPGGCVRPRSGRTARGSSRSSCVVRRSVPRGRRHGGRSAPVRAPCTGASSGQGQPPKAVRR